MESLSLASNDFLFLEKEKGKPSYYLVLQPPKVLFPLRRCTILWPNMALLGPTSTLGSFISFEDDAFLFMGENRKRQEL